jgi:teichuronic acid biosynthesis glycosyltransferase TuaC
MANGIELDYFCIEGGGLKNYLRHIPILKKYLKTHRCDLIHSHYGLNGWVALLTFTRLPIVISFMGDDLYGDADERGKIDLKDRFYILAGQLLQYWMDYIIVKSENLARWIHRKKKMAIVPNGVDFEAFKPMPKAEARKKLNLENNHRKYVLFLGDPENPRKNFALLEKALQKLDGIEVLTPFPVQGDAIPLYLNAADVLAMTSFKEGSPNVIKEAMACNTPIVSTEVGDVRDVIANTEGCFLTDFDADELSEKVQAALRFGRKTSGRNDIEHLELNVIAEKIIGIYNTLILKKKKK